MPKRRVVVVAIAAVVAQLSASVLGACPFAQFKPSCGFVGDRLSNDPESFDRRIATLERELARRPNPGAFRDLYELLEKRFFESPVHLREYDYESWDREFKRLAVERGRLVQRWLRAFPDDPHATLAAYSHSAQKLGPEFDRGATLRAAHARFPDFVPIATELVIQLVDWIGTEEEARSVVRDMVADHGSDVEVLHLAFEFEWTADRLLEASRALAAWRELAPNDPRALFHAVVLDGPRLDDAALDARLEELFELEDDVATRLAVCPHLGDRDAACEQRALARWDPWRAEAPERRAALWRMRTAESVDAARVVLELEKDPHYRAEFADRLFDLAVDSSRCDVAREFVELLDGARPTRYGRRSLARRCDTGNDEVLERVQGLLAERPPDWEIALKNERRQTEEVWSELHAALARTPGDKFLWSIALDWAESEEKRSELHAAWAAAVPSDPWPREFVARDRAKNGDTDDLVQILVDEIDAARKPWRRDQSTSDLLTLLLERGELNRLRRRAVPMLTEDEDVVWAARLGLARADLAEGDLELALGWLEGKPSGRWFWEVEAERARTLERLSRFDDAEAAWMATDRSSVFDASQLARMALDHDLVPTAERLARRALATDRDEPDLWSVIGDVAHRTGRPRTAEFAYDRALLLRFDQPEALDGMLALLVESKRFDDAERLVRASRHLAAPGREALERAAEAALLSERLETAALFREAAARASAREPEQELYFIP